MSVYVGSSNYIIGRMIMCHMVADSIEELHEMADNINLSRRHFQSARLPHYDISKSKKAIAIRFGAIEVNEYKIVEVVKNCNERTT